MTDPSPAVEAAVRAIPPLWPLATSVAVNPFLGQSGEDLGTAAARLGRAAGARVTMPRAWYRDRIADGRIRDEDLAAALAASCDPQRPGDLAALKQAAAGEGTSPRALPTIAELAEAETGVDWPGLVASRIGAWASGHFDRGQALWAAPQHGGPYRRWRTFASHDLTPEIAGLKGFCSHVATAPAEAREAIARAVASLGLSTGEQEAYFHRLLMDLGGWAQHARYLLWQAERNGRTDTTVMELLALRLVWEEALLQRGGERVNATWQAARAAYGQPLAPTPDLIVDAILQEAAERAGQRALSEILAAPHEDAPPTTPSLQAVFCIDVRSEVFRRALEAADPGITTAGFAGFFGLPVSHRDFASDTEELRLPVLLTPALRTRASGTEEADRSARLSARASRAWGRFKLAAVSSFAFVEASGPIYAARLLRDALGLGRSAGAVPPAPQIVRAMDPMIRIALAERVLRAMSMTQGFARLVLLVGHGAGVVNNPQASALHCGACGGHKGEVNARLLAGMLNDAGTRKGLARRGIVIPDGTLFVAALHDTTADAVSLFDGDCPSEGYREDLSRARRWLDQAGRAARAERVLRLPAVRDAEDLLRRGRDWSQVRPEWALAGCSAFVAAPRRRTHGRNLHGRAFLHDYDWKADRDFSVLELILTAPVVVASWISLQYYGSVVAPDVFGSGNKLLHNVTGGLGVVEGNGGLLRSGLALQSVSDGEQLAHDPLRLTVCIEAPREAMSAVLERHPGVRALFDNRWLHLFALGPDGRMAWRYAGDLAWVPAENAAGTNTGELALAS